MESFYNTFIESTLELVLSFCILYLLHQMPWLFISGQKCGYYLRAVTIREQHVFTLASFLGHSHVYYQQFTRFVQVRHA